MTKEISGNTHSTRTLGGDIRRVVREHPVAAGLGVVAMSIAAGSTWLGVNNESAQTPRVCIPPEQNISGSANGGTVSGIAAERLNEVIDVAGISPSSIPNFDAELNDLTTYVAADIGTKYLQADKTYNMSEQTCITQSPSTGEIHVTTDRQP